MSQLAVTIDGRRHNVEVDLSRFQEGVYLVTVDGEEIPVTLPDADIPFAQLEWMIVGDRPYELHFDTELSWLRAYSGLHKIDVRDLEAKVMRPASGDGRIKAPIPGLIARLLVDVGDDVVVDQPIAVLEAMKMENEIRSPTAGKVLSIQVEPGHSVVRSEVLAEIG